MPRFGLRFIDIEIFKSDDFEFFDFRFSNSRISESQDAPMRNVFAQPATLSVNHS